jgi:hypothetical protein
MNTSWTSFHSNMKQNICELLYGKMKNVNGVATTLSLAFLPEFSEHFFLSGLCKDKNVAL